MKKTTKLWLGLGAAAGGVWAWMRYGSAATIAASRVAPPGYVDRQNVMDGSGRAIAMRFLYPQVAGRTPTYTVPFDPNQRGYAGFA